MEYTYQALNKTGKVEKGTIVADGETSVREEMRVRGLYLVSLKEAEGDQKKRFDLFSFRLKEQLPMLLARQLASLLKGGVPLFQALTIIANQMDQEKAKEIVATLRDQVRGGSSLSGALAGFPAIFDNLFVYSVQAGERSGALDAILAYQADFLENRAVLKGKIRSALMYPLIMVIVGAGVLVFLMAYVVPMVVKIFERVNQGLPLVTKILIAGADLFNRYLYLAIPGAVAAGFLLRRWLGSSPQAKNAWDRLLLRLPVYGGLHQMMLVGRFARIMSTLLKSGVTMVQALIVVSRTMKNSVTAEGVRKMAELVEGGADLSSALRTVSTFPSYLTDMVVVGESGGNLEEMLARVSDFYETRVNQRLAALTSLVEPMIILIMGMVVAFVLVSILLPLFDMNKILLKR